LPASFTGGIFISTRKDWNSSSRPAAPTPEDASPPIPPS